MEKEFIQIVETQSSNEIPISELISLLTPEQTLKIYPHGLSMHPFFVGDRDTIIIKKPSFPLNRGDIALYSRSDNTLVIHRIHYYDSKNNTYFMLGDNQTWIEGPIDEFQILAVAVTIIRKGKSINCHTNLFYIFLWKLWLRLRPIRPVFIKAWLLIRPSIDKKEILKEMAAKRQ